MTDATLCALGLAGIVYFIVTVWSEESSYKHRKKMEREYMRRALEEIHKPNKKQDK